MASHFLLQGGRHGMGLPTHQLCAFAIFITGQHKLPSNAPAGHMRRQQSGRELDRATINTLGYDLIDAAAVILQVLLRSQIQAENKLLHDVKVMSTKRLHFLDEVNAQLIN
ncbi:hypothetical protein [Rhodoferax sp. GW822-FHT02A01]|uniref:hypothetical protein n=1 Tax=Rhodoferax sp. GW822-FHT02A01 TaxID=3141537 RepID=UPI00315C8169